MAAKRALVVDDSKSARTFLAKMLEKYELEVVSVESAEQAIEYLVHHRPDVIFMDHLMPGMDGFQAVQAIKNNPRTATIPIMMYTSQEGELYLGQARALGAVGVLPKQIKPADVSKVLYQLHLLPERRRDDPGPFRPLGGGVEILEGDTTPVARPATEIALREQLAELRRAMAASLDDHAERLRSDLRAELLDAAATSRHDTGASPKRRIAAGWIAALAAGVIAVAALAAAARQAERGRMLAAQLAELRAAVASLAPSLKREAEGGGSDSATAELPPDGPTGTSDGAGPDRGADAVLRRADAAVGGGGAAMQAARSAAPAARPVIEVVPFGEDPLGGSRLDAMRQLFDRLLSQGFRGVVEVKVFPGRFCLMGDAADGFSPAPAETPYARCDLVGSPQSRGDGPPAQRVPVAFADLAADLRSASRGAIDVQVLPGDAKSTLVAYPPITDSLTAGEWNGAADANNRIEIRLR